MKFWKWCLGQGKPEKVFALVIALKNTLYLETRVLGRAPSWQLTGLGGVGPSLCLWANLHEAVEAQPKAFCIPAASFLLPESSLLVPPCVLERSGTFLPTIPLPQYLLFISPPPARNVRPKMTIYVCQELEQNRAPLQKRDGGGDSSLCGELWGALPCPANPGPVTGWPGHKKTQQQHESSCPEHVHRSPHSAFLRGFFFFPKDEFLLNFLLGLKCLRWKSCPRTAGPAYLFAPWGAGPERGCVPRQPLA